MLNFFHEVLFMLQLDTIGVNYKNYKRVIS